MKININISGIHCTSCAGITEKALQKVVGVKEATVNSAAENKCAGWIR